tara:strand:+ start:35736 stop:36422 length:687 start_codon:yes stop_codon:yes gene_type:complete
MKKKYPIQILKQLNQLKKNPPQVAKLVKPTKGLIWYEDLDTESDFYFKINSFSENKSGFFYSVIYKPQSGNKLGEISASLRYADVLTHIKNWAAVIKDFNETEYFEDDPITQNYTSEFFEEYKLVDDGADIEPFDLRRQILIDKYLDSSIKYLEKYEEKNEGIDLSEPIKQAKTVKSTLTELSKNAVIKGLSKFWALCRKEGIPILKKVFFELAKEFVKEIGKGMIGM